MPVRFGVMVIILGLLLLLTPRYIFPVCGVGRYAPPPGAPHTVHKCTNTYRAETALAIAALVIGAICIIRPRRKSVVLSSAAMMLVAALVILFPLVITGVCNVPTMTCRTATLPALVILGAVMALLAAGGLIMSRKIP